jgi:lambda family phage holin
MTHPDPTLWASLLAWLHDNGAVMYGAALAVVIAWLRITWQGGRGRRRCIESLLCGAISLAVSNGMEFFFGVPRDCAGFVGGAIGFVGVDVLRHWSLRALLKETNSS